MADKYAHLAPAKPRECHRDDGTPKVRYANQTVAEHYAAEHGDAFHAYQCAEGHWHVGHTPIDDDPLTATDSTGFDTRAEAEGQR